MQSYDLWPNPTLISPNPHLLDPPTMETTLSSPIHSSLTQPDPNGNAKEGNPIEGLGDKELGSSDNISSKDSKKESISISISISTSSSSNTNTNNVIVRRERPIRACTTRPPKYVDPPMIERRARPPKRERVEKVEVEELEEEEDENEEEGREQCSGSVSSGKVVTSLVNAPTPEQMPRWSLRSMWELASILNFLNVFRPLLNIRVEFSAEELESALLNPNATLGDIHIPLLKAIPPVTRMACGRDTWVTVLCRKLRDWWHWVAEGELPIVADHGTEIEAYRTLDPGIRVVILKALCDIRVEQEDIRIYIENSLKHGAQLSAFRKERIGGDSHGISYWYEDDETIGHRLYREIRKVERKVEMKKGKTKGSHVLPCTTYEWETVATNLDEFLDVSEKLFLSKNRTEASLGKKLKNNMLPDIEKIHKRKEKLLKKQQREALLLDNFNMDGLVAGRSLRDRKPVTYTFDDFDRSINEAIKVTKAKQPSTEPTVRREGMRSESAANGRWNGLAHGSLHGPFSPPSPMDYDEMDDGHKAGPLDRSNRRRQRPQRYSSREFVEAISDQEENFDSDDDIVGEAVYDEEYLRQRKHRKKTASNSSEEGVGDEEYQWTDENGDDDVEEEDSMSFSEEEDGDDSDQPRGRRFKRSSDSTRAGRGGSRVKSVDELQAGVRRSKRATRIRINYRKYEFSESENELSKSERNSDATESEESMETRDSFDNNEDQEKGSDQPPAYMDVEKHESAPMTKQGSPSQNEEDGVGPRKFLDLNELAPGPGFEDGPTSVMINDNNGGQKHE